MELDHEKFEGVKELAEISTKISQGTAALQSLKDNEASYLDEREIKLVERLKQALVDSSDLIKAIGANHSALVGYKTELVDFHTYVLSLVQDVMDCITLVTNASIDLEKRMTQHEAEVVAFREDTQRVNALIDGQRHGLTIERADIDAGWRLLNDRKSMFERTLARTAPTKK